MNNTFWLTISPRLPTIKSREKLRNVSYVALLSGLDYSGGRKPIISNRMTYHAIIPDAIFFPNM